MDANEIISIYQQFEEKKDTGKSIIKGKETAPFENCKIFGCGDRIVFGEWSIIKPVIEQYADDIVRHCGGERPPQFRHPRSWTRKTSMQGSSPARLSGNTPRSADKTVIMMGAVINIGAVIGEGSMIDMNAVLGGEGYRGKELPYRRRLRAGRRRGASVR